MAQTVDMGAIRDVYRKWLEGSLSEEEALFEIGDLLAEAHEPHPAPRDPQPPR